MIRLGSNNIAMKAGTTGNFQLINPPQSETTITRTMGSGTDDEFTFSWTLTGVASHGTFRDGTPWVVPASGGSVQLTAATPTNQTQTVTGITFDDDELGDLTIRHSGIIVNPTGGPSRTLVEYASGDNTYSGNWRQGDNRIGNRPVNHDDAQTQCDEYFDVAGFTQREADMTSGGIALSTGDVCVLTNSMFDASDLEYSGSNSIGCTGNSGNGDTWGILTGIRWQAALYVLSSAPASPSTTFRPPVIWSNDQGDRPLFTEADVDLASLQSLISDQSGSDLDNAEIGYGYDPDFFTGDDFITGPIILDRSGVSYVSQIAAFNICPGLRSTYGGDIAGVFSNMVCKSFYDPNNSSIDTARLYSYLQYALDVYGNLAARTMASSGAGQKAGQTLPPVLFLCKALIPLQSQYGIDEVLEGLFDASYKTNTGDSSYVDLTASEKLTMREFLFYEERTARPVGASGSGAFAWDTTGSSLRGTIPASTVQSSDVAVRQKRIKEISGNWTLEDYTSNDNIMSTTGAEGEGNYDFLAYQDGNPAGVVGFGHLEVDTRPTDLWNGADDKTHDYFNLLGGTIQIDSDLYYIVAISPNISPSESTPTSASPIHIIVDRPLENAPTGSSTISIYPFRQTDVGKHYFSREGDTRPQWFGASLLADGYGKFLQRSSAAVFTALRLLDGDNNKLGKQGALLQDHLWDPTADQQWQFGNDSGPRNMHAFLMRQALFSGDWTLAITGQQSDEVSRTLPAAQQP